MARSASGLISIAVIWVPIGILLAAHLPFVMGYSPGDPFYFTVVGTGVILGALSLFHLKYSMTAVALAIILYLAIMPIVMLIVVFILGWFTGLVKIGHI
jgi:hypothetical protein